MLNFAQYAGFPIHTNHLLTTTQYRVVPRTWKERLFTRPWRPAQGTKREAYEVPSTEIFMIRGAIYCHPETAAKIKAAIEESRPKSYSDSVVTTYRN